jgi:hypothetical protein
VKQIFIVISFLIAINFVVGACYGSIRLTAEELIETNSLQEMLEKVVDEKGYFVLPSFRLISPLIEKEEIVYSQNNSGIFSSYEQVLLLLPPDFLRSSSGLPVSGCS